MSEDEFLASITVRLSYSMMREIRSNVGRKKKFRNQSDAIRSFVSLGIQVDAMMQAMKDPAKKEEFEKKISSLIQDENTEKQLESMDESDINRIIYLCEKIKEKKVTQLLLDMKQS